VLGWEHHVWQRGLSRKSIATRRDDIDSLYSSAKLEDAIRVVHKYGIDAVIVSKLERERYNRVGISKFEEATSFFEKVFESGDSVIYKTGLFTKQ